MAQQLDSVEAPDDAGLGTRPGVLGIADLYDEVDDALARAFPRGRQLWVRGEIQSLSDRTGHCYMDLVDPEQAGERQAPALKVKCWRTAWGQVKAALARAGIELAPGTVVVIRGTVDFYRPRAELGFILAELDVTALLGRLAAQRAALVRALTAEGLVERNRSLPVPAVPLRVGLVASPGTEGYHDFLGQLEASGLAFRVAVAPATVQGPDAPTSIARALERIGRRGVDLAVVVRGGGSKADLAAFDSEAVARAIATAPVPVWTGIGHTGDQSVADLVANCAYVTPTECGQELASRVHEWTEAHVGVPAARVAARSADAVDQEERRARDARHRLATTARHQVRWHGERLAGRLSALRAGAPLVVDASHARLRDRAQRVGPLALGHLARAEAQAGSWRRLLAAYDVQGQLERGYTLTSDQHGRVLRSTEGLVPGTVLSTRFADGVARSVVEELSDGAGSGEERS